MCGIVFLGLAAGTEVDMIGFLTSRYFGLRYFGELYGYIFAIFSAGAALAPHGLLHRASRNCDQTGAIIQTTADYAAVRELVVAVFFARLEATVRKRCERPSMQFRR